MIIGLMGQKRVGKDTAGAVIAKELGGTTLAFADPIKRWCMLAMGLSEAQLWGDEKEKPFTKKWLKASRPQDGVSDLWVRRLSEACCMLPGHEWSNTSVDRGMRVWWNELSQEAGLTPRRVMQHFGTEFVRKRLGPHFWIDHGLRIAGTLLEGGAVYSKTKGVIPDEACNSNATVFTDVRFRNEVLALRRCNALIYGVTRPGAVDQRNKMKSDRRVAAGKVVDVARHASELEQGLGAAVLARRTHHHRFETKEEFQHAVQYIARHMIATRGPVVY